MRLPLAGLAETLHQLALEGPRSFYQGGVAQTLLADCATLGVPVDAADLAGYRARIMPPLAIDYRGGRMLAMPGLYAGVSLARCLKLLQARNFGGDAPGEPAFNAYAQALLAAYRERLAGEGAAGSERTPSCTSHVSVVDRHGNLVALTQTLLSTFGSKLLGAGHGPAAEQRHHVVRPAARRPQRDRTGRGSRSPTCARRSACMAERRFALGASGGRRILPAVLQVASFLIDFGMGLEEAFHQPRLDVSGPDLVTVDARLGIAPDLDRPDGAVCRSLPAQVMPLLFACATAVLEDEADGWRYGMTEPMQPAADAVAES